MIKPDESSLTPNYLRVSVTDRCNLRCIYCLGQNDIKKLQHKEILNFEEIFQVVRIANEAGVKTVRVTGGEPLVRKGVVGFLARLINELDLEDVSLTTNGVLFKDRVDELWETGLRRVNISLDTLKPSKFKAITKNEGLSHVLSGIERALVLGFDPVKINMVVLKGLNENEIPEFAKMSRDQRVHVRFIEWMNFNKLNRNDWLVPFSKIKQSCETVGDLIPASAPKGHGPARYFKYQASKGTIGFITPRSHPFCSRCRRLRLTSTGQLLGCLQDSHGIEFMPLLRGRADNDIGKLIETAMAIKICNVRKSTPRFRNIPQAMVSVGG